MNTATGFRKEAFHESRAGVLSSGLQWTWDARFPLTPALSLGEREKHRLPAGLCGTIQIAVYHRCRPLLLTGGGLLYAPLRLRQSCGNEYIQRRRWSSLSPRERVGVRGKCASENHRGPACQVPLPVPGKRCWGVNFRLKRAGARRNDFFVFCGLLVNL